MQVLGYRILIKPDSIEKQSSGGIIVVSSVDAEKLEQAGQEIGTVIQVGSLAYKAHEKGPNGEHVGKPWVAPGDRVQYHRYGGKPVKDPVTQEEYIAIVDEDILVKFND